MELIDLDPKEVSLNVSGLTLTFRPFTLADSIRIEKQFGGSQAVKKAIEDFDFKAISSIAWYQLKTDSQKEIIKAVSAVSLDPETGEEVEITISPIDKFRNLFEGLSDQARLLTTLVNCHGLNMPDIENKDEIKKWVDQMEKIRLMQQ